MRLEVPIPFIAFADSYNQAKFIDLCQKYSEHISSIYCGIGYIDRDKCLVGLRNTTNIPLEQYEESLHVILKAVNKPVKIVINDLLAAEVLENLEKVKAKIRYIQSIANVQRLVIADPSMLTALLPLEIPFELSVNAYKTVEELLMWKEIDVECTISSVVLNRQWNRSSEILESIDATLPQYAKSILVNEGCVLDCPYKTAGDIAFSLAGKSIPIHNIGCTHLQKNSEWMFIGSPFLTRKMILDSGLDRYEIKLAGRNMFMDNLKKMFKHYIDGESVELSAILSTKCLPGISTSHIDIHASQLSTCSKSCTQCRECKMIFAELKPKV